MKTLALLVAHEDPQRLASLAEHLRSAGYLVTGATSGAELLALAATTEADAVLLSRAIAGETADGLELVDAIAIAATRPGPVLVLAPAGAILSGVEVHEDDPDAILARLPTFAPLSETRSSARVTQLSVNLAPIAALVATLAEEGRSGTLDVIVPRPPSRRPSSRRESANERAILCLRRGQLVDVTFAQQRGEKALARVVALRDATSRFTPGESDVLARLAGSTRVLLERASARADALVGLAERLPSPLAQTRYARANDVRDSDAQGLSARVFALVHGPTLVTELLERLPEPDSDVLAAVLALEAIGQLRQVRASGDMATIASPETLPALRAAAAHGNAGFSGAARLVLAGSLADLAPVASLLLRIVEATPPDGLPNPLPAPRVAAVLLLGEGVRVEVVALPTVEAYAPTWPLFVAGAHAVIPLRAADHAAVLRACPDAADRIREPDAPRSWEATSPDELARLLRASLGVADVD